MPRCAVIFSHPNHEIAIWGYIHKLQPIIVFLTDGGGKHRIEQTREGLASFIDRDSVHFLNYPERAIYEALLKVDERVFRNLAAEVARLIAGDDLDAIYCDSVEFYNPVHDISLPVTRAAFPNTKAKIFEVPLVHQISMNPEGYELLRAPCSLWQNCIWYNLSDEERTEKQYTFKSVYTLLSDQLGRENVEIAIANSGREQVIAARTGRPEPVDDQILRYEWRGSVLKQRGKVAEVITYREHYAPIFDRLVS